MNLPADITLTLRAHDLRTAHGDWGWTVAMGHENGPHGIGKSIAEALRDLADVIDNRARRIAEPTLIQEATKP